MNPYAEEEQVEALKKWWMTNGGAIIAGVILGLVAVFGWRYWLAHQERQAVQASARYDELANALEGADVEQARQRGQALVDDFPRSVYAVLSALKLAKLAIDNNDLTAAAKHLEWVIGQAGQDDLRDIARLRLARVLLAQNQFDAAAAQLDQIKSLAFNAEREELRGDLHGARNEPDKARAAYQAAMAAGGSGFLPIKLNNLPPATTPEKN